MKQEKFTDLSAGGSSKKTLAYVFGLLLYYLVSSVFPYFKIIPILFKVFMLRSLLGLTHKRSTSPLFSPLLSLLENAITQNFIGF
jgi:hypothetical protein